MLWEGSRYKASVAGNGAPGSSADREVTRIDTRDTYTTDNKDISRTRVPAKPKARVSTESMTGELAKSSGMPSRSQQKTIRNAMAVNEGGVMATAGLFFLHSTQGNINSAIRSRLNLFLSFMPCKGSRRRWVLMETSQKNQTSNALMVSLPAFNQDIN
ncbi:hypothetical protein MRB53_005766 [Persea americana]|uniref:Uncharacterized protein n=1 Tax=Persea americana TaxID=3435 RepID=A0ACC2MEJ0_PERAE|nr:hypothetical protein MRB53_005766 [Persea americana]